MYRLLPDRIQSDFLGALPLRRGSLEACCLLNHQPCIQQSKAVPETRRHLISVSSCMHPLTYISPRLEHSEDEGVDTDAPCSDWAQAALCCLHHLRWRPGGSILNNTLSHGL